MFPTGDRRRPRLGYLLSPRPHRNPQNVDNDVESRSPERIPDRCDRPGGSGRAASSGPYHRRPGSAQDPSSRWRRTMTDPGSRLVRTPSGRPCCPSTWAPSTVGRGLAAASTNRGPCRPAQLGSVDIDGEARAVPAARSGGTVSQEESSEAHLPAQRPPALQAPRLPQADVDPGRSGRDPQPASQGSGSALSLIAPLRDHRTLELVRQRGRRGRSGPVTVRLVAAPDERSTLVAFAIGRRTGSAVTRNRIRRRLRAALAELARSGSVPAGAAVVSAGPSAATVPFPALRQALDQALVRAASPPSSRTAP